MPRALAGAVGAMLAIAVGVSAPKAPAQVPAPQRQGQHPPVRRECFPRLEEMKVELALLSDPTTFPYSVAASARDGALELYGFVPNGGIRQHVLDVARRSTSLMVHDALGIKPIPGLQPSPRLSSVLQKEGMELLKQEIGETAKRVSLEAQPNGAIVLNGRIDSFEDKVKISRLFRQLSGCCGVVNKLTVEPIVRDGKRVVRVARDGSLCVPPSVMGIKELAATPPPPTILLTNNQSSQNSGRSLPPAVPSKPPSKPITPTPAPPKLSSTPITPMPAPSKPTRESLMPTPAKIGNAPDLYAPSKLPVKWGRPASSWETQANELEALHAAHQQSLMPTPVETPKRPPEPKKATPLPTVAIQPSQLITSPRPNFAEVRPAPAPAPAPDMSWRRPGGSEESEPRSQPPTRDVDAAAKPLPSLRSARRWPPAYVTGPPPAQGRPGVIVFDDDPPPAAATAPSRPIVPADLQNRIKMLCGSEAREVVVATQRDGNMLIRVRVANRSTEDQLSRKILTLPEMTSPQVRLLMEVGP